jgi:UDP-N-acetylmuramoyl-L-alanyl-D-glutamate--2,6-diaminopimelate ligase
LRLTELMSLDRGDALIGSDPDITGLTADSRAVRPGYLFAALAGSKTDGRKFIADALARGAAAVLSDLAEPLPAAAVPFLYHSNPRQRLAQLAARFHAPQPRTIVAVTGTNGKTSTVDFTRQLWQALGQPAASLGTLGIRGPGVDRPGSLTTPDPVSLHQELAALARAGIEHAALEASSHGLAQYRLDGLRLAAAAFTNLTRDHLDYHPDMAAYFAAKARLFDELLPADAAAVLNADVIEGGRLATLCRHRHLRIITFGRAPDADLRLLAAGPRGSGQALTISVFGARHDFLLPLAGAFQASNALAALGLVIATGSPVEAAVAALGKLTGVAGRMEHVASHPNGAPVIVDYAHTPDALETLLTALRPHCRGRLVVVFGCGGDRDRGKRPQMGEIAACLADVAIVTDDNPRSEDAATIRRAILDACPGAREIGDRAAAIDAALRLLRPDDLLVVAGKGHERGQIVGTTVLPFDDAEVARAGVAKLTGASA